MSTRKPRGSAPKKDVTAAIIALAEARDLHSALSAVARLERLGCTWTPVGGQENNYGTINIGSDPGHALVERVTNAIDAIVEREALKKLGRKQKTTPPSTPREAVETWLGIPGGRVANLSIKKRQQIANNIVVALLNGSRKRKPTVLVRDLGVGLTAALIPETILSLLGSNKIDKPFLAGAYGQGGSTALAFSPEGTLIASRRQPALRGSETGDHVAVTLVRYNELDFARNKNGRYEYLVDQSGVVCSIPATALAEFEAGTLVVHYDLAIPKYAARMTQLTGSLWWLLQNTLFDPVLPLWVEERRTKELKKGQAADRRSIAGNYTRLADDRKDKIEHADSVDVIVEHDSGRNMVKVNYWVVRQNQGERGTRAIESYVDPYRPVSYTYFGQTHGTDERRFVSERLALPYLAKSLVVQVELDGLTPQARRELLSTTRDRLKQLPLFEQMRECICSALAEDEDLIRLNTERKERLLSDVSERERTKMKERFARLMEKFAAGADAPAAGKKGEGPGRPDRPSGPRVPLEPLPTKNEPTFIRIANVQKPVRVRVDRHALIRLESDAPDGYLTNHVHARLTTSTEPDKLLVLESRSDFRGGRSRITVRGGASATAGAEGALTVWLLTPSGDSLRDTVNVRIEDSETGAPTTGKGKAQVKTPDPVPVTRDRWDEFGWDAHSVAEVREDEKDTEIFVNIDNRHLARLLQGGGYQETGVTRMRNNYLLYVAFYAWRQKATHAGRDTALEGKEFEDYLQEELDRAAQTVVYAISAGGRLEE